jgi:NAD(P)-dependent dehydrogenase (short-subunit alcohol dehydrogenase family)
MIEPPNFRMDGRVALVTGAGRGIGLAIARALAAVGCAVAIQDVELDVAAAEVRKLPDDGAKAHALGGDLTDLAIAEQLVRETIDKLGGLHVLVNNGSIQQTKHWTKVTPDDAEKQHRANVLMPMLLCQQVAPIFRAQRWGRIVNIGSVQQRTGNPDMLPYSMSKAALVHLTMALAKDLARHGVTVNTIAPGYYNTYRNRNELGTEEQRRQAGERHIPIGRVGEPDDVAGAALLLCSDAGAYITGQTLYVDGGITAQ